MNQLNLFEKNYTDGGRVFTVTLLSIGAGIWHYINLNNGILKSNSSIFPRSEGVYGLIVNENNEVNISLMVVKMI